VYNPPPQCSASGMTHFGDYINSLGMLCLALLLKLIIIHESQSPYDNNVVTTNLVYIFTIVNGSLR
jgi:hypothetical protein